MLCPCGSQNEYANCCALFIEQGVLPASAEQLMRSRYSAYTLAKITYIQNTMQGPAAVGFDVSSALLWIQQAEWIGLKVVQAFPSLTNPNIHFVEFIAEYKQNGQKRTLHELSEFHLNNEKWYYVNGKTMKVGRNDPCPCGSGLKHKKCCGH